MKKRNLIYIAIIVICVISVFVAVYYQLFVENNKPNVVEIGNNTPINDTKQDEIDLEKIKDEFNNLFDNKFNKQGYDTSSIKKIKALEAEDVVYMGYEIDKEETGKYDVNLHVPIFNVDGEAASQVNSSTQSVFANKANDIFANAKVFTIYNIDYTAYLNDNILSLVIRATLKEGDNAQRLIVQTHNYDIKSGKIITLNELLTRRGIAYKEVNSKIEKYINEANKQAQAVSMALSGQSVYIRDVNNAMYVTDNSNYFFIGPDGDIYILYPYGNSNYTSEIDIIKI
ncbi:MAG: hypothetical protein J6M60_02015 [Clostridia bacterium]|nr:hypothetical protein [Clostridia bacterium]